MIICRILTNGESALCVLAIGSPPLYYIDITGHNNY